MIKFKAARPSFAARLTLHYEVEENGLGVLRAVCASCDVDPKAVPELSSLGNRSVSQRPTINCDARALTCPATACASGIPLFERGMP